MAVKSSRSTTSSVEREDKLSRRVQSQSEIFMKDEQREAILSFSHLSISSSTSLFPLVLLWYSTIKMYKVSHRGRSIKGHLGQCISFQYWPSQVEHVPALANHTRCPEGWEWDALLCFRLMSLLQSAARRCKSDELLTSSGSIYPLLPPALSTDWACDRWWSTMEIPSSSTVCNYAQVHCWSVTGGPRWDLGSALYLL